ncbi:MAG: ABC transporter permease, partial [Acidobacteria bacterium]|nr:ABC transporter permease [Acidobacteriota bacterium]
MTFVVRMALREIRASWRRLLFFFVCIAIGVGSIVALRSVIQSVRDAISRESRALIAADVLITSDRPFTELVTGTLEQAAREARITGQSEAVEI